VKFVFILTIFFLVTFSIFVVNSISVYGQIEEDYCQGTNNEHCYAIANYDPEGVAGIRSSIETSDLYIEPIWDTSVTDPDTLLAPTNDCRKNVAVTSIWLVSNNAKWIEAGITSGGFTELDGSDTCTTNQFAYYALGDPSAHPDSIISYIQIAIPEGRADAGEIYHFQLERDTITGESRIYFDDGSGPIQVFNNVHGDFITHAQVGIEGQ